VWLPIDAKFPREDYERLMAAQDQADPVAAESAAKQLEACVKGFAWDIHDKYLNPPQTTDFGIMFLPTEGLYAEVLRRPGLTDVLQRECRVVVAGPTTLWALLNSLQMGFRTLAIEQRSSEVWKLLGAVKAEFGKFGDILEKVHKKLQEASNTIEDASKKTRTIGRRLREVEELPADAARDVLALESGPADEEPEGT
jgi:DNA recombination protein RmuC